jgi:hypothetical protein
VVGEEDDVIVGEPNAAVGLGLEYFLRRISVVVVVVMWVTTMLGKVECRRESLQVVNDS